jgi:hypothetical protein
LSISKLRTCNAVRCTKDGPAQSSCHTRVSCPACEAPPSYVPVAQRVYSTAKTLTRAARASGPNLRRPCALADLASSYVSCDAFAPHEAHVQQIQRCATDQPLSKAFALHAGFWKSVTVAVKIIEHLKGFPGTASSGGTRIEDVCESLLAIQQLSHPNIVSAVPQRYSCCSSCRSARHDGNSCTVNGGSVYTYTYKSRMPACFCPAAQPRGSLQ